VLNLALRNTDNHARNSAVQRLSDGTVQLTPLFDFSPMYLDPELVPRTVNWRDERGRRLDDWPDILDSLALAGAERARIDRELAAFAAVLERLPAMARDCGVEEAVLLPCLDSIAAQHRGLANLATSPGRARRRGHG
jgi:serine/threonine-protein kinase HipA